MKFKGPENLLFVNDEVEMLMSIMRLFILTRRRMIDRNISGIFFGGK